MEHFYIIQALARTTMGNSPNDAQIHQLNRLIRVLWESGDREQAQKLLDIITPPEHSGDAPFKIVRS